LDFKTRMFRFVNNNDVVTRVSILGEKRIKKIFSKSK